jgi:hypothetical protein
MMLRVDDYAFTTALTREQWAWEFLRRNPAYRSDYAWFIATWRALEQDYGAPPHRDFLRWQADARAYRLEADAADAEGCAGDENRVPIECWMGARWGFHKFPLDPAVRAPTPEQLSWRPVRTGAIAVTAQSTDYLGESRIRLALGFDLTLPLPAQLEAAKFSLISIQTALRRQGVPVPASVACMRVQWTRCLRLLDAEATGVPLEEAAPEVQAPEIAADLRMARDLRDGGYRRILLLAEK